MTVPASPRRTPAQAGDGVNLDFDFDFLVYENTQVRVVVLNEETSVETDAVLDTDYTVSLNPDQAVAPGGLLFPAGVLVGKVKKIYQRESFMNFITADIEPAVNVNTLKEVFVVKRSLPEELLGARQAEKK